MVIVGCYKKDREYLHPAVYRKFRTIQGEQLTYNSKNFGM